MSVTATTIGPLEKYLPNWFSHPPLKKNNDHKIQGDWCRIRVWKRDQEGNLIKVDGSAKSFEYFMENSTGDLYGIYGNESCGNDDKFYKTSIKAVLVFLGTPLYMLCMIGAHLTKIVIDISSIFWKIIPQCISVYKDKGLPGSLSVFFMTVVWQLPSEISTTIWRIVRSPLYAVGMMCAALLGIVYPAEGRKWMGLVEYEWHDRTSYTMDMRYQRKFEKGFEAIPFSELVSELAKGKVFFLGYCFQKRGNINDKVHGVSRFLF